MFPLSRTRTRMSFPTEGFATRSRPMSGVQCSMTPPGPADPPQRRPWSASIASRSTPDLSSGGPLGTRTAFMSIAASPRPGNPVALKPSNSATSRPASDLVEVDAARTARPVTARERLQALMSVDSTQSRVEGSRPPSASAGGGGGRFRPASGGSHGRSVEYRPGIRMN
jgi:hypothetical protein